MSGAKAKPSSGKKKAQIRIGKYLLLEQIGVGGFGVVRKAVNEEDGTIVAIKILDKAELQVQDMTEHAKREIALLTMVNHPNIVQGLAVLSSKKKLFLVMEYVDGGDLHSMLASRGKLSEQEARELFCSLVVCLDYCHRQGIYHRDLKLENILITSSGQLKICDFGLASVRALQQNDNDLCRTIVGTEDFSPPEVLKNVPYMGDKADMWSAGILLFTMLAGYCPFQGREQKELQEKILRCRYSFPKGFPEGPKEIVKRLLVPRGNDRQSAGELLVHPWVKTTLSLRVRESSHDTQHAEKEQCANATNGSVSLRANTEDALSSRKKKSSRIGPRRRKKNSRGSDDDTGLGSGMSTARSTHDRTLYMAIGMTTIENFPSLLEAMQDSSTGIQVQNRRWRWRAFEQCFVGTDAVSWLTGRVGCSRENAVALGQKFLDAGAFHHVCREHDFKDELLFYRWLDSEPENAFTLNLRSFFPKAVFPPNPIIVSRRLLDQMLTLCKSHQAPLDHQIVALNKVHSDELFTVFMTAVTELQIVSINALTGDQQRKAFLVNTYNLLWLHARIHIGDFEKGGFQTLKRTARSFQYNIGGVKVSLADLSDLLFTGSEINISESHQSYLRRESTGSSRSFGPSSTGNSSMLTRLMSAKNHDKMDSLSESLKLENPDPMVQFVTSEGSPQSPIIRALSENEVSFEYMMQAAAEYLDLVLELNVENCCVSYPPKVARFREMSSLSDDDLFLDELIRICEGQPVVAGLKAVQKRSRDEKVPLTAVERTEAELAFSLTWFAPRIGNPL